MAKALGYLRRLIPIPDGWTAEDARLHAACEFADERTMPPLPPKPTAEELGRWANDLAATHERGDLARMIFTLLAVDARLPASSAERWQFGVDYSADRTFSPPSVKEDAPDV